jgi:HemY protein
MTGRLDAFQWQTPVAALPSEKSAALEAKEFNEAMLAPRRVEPPRHPAAAEPAPEGLIPAAQDNSPAHSPAKTAAVESAPPAVAPAPSPPEAEAPIMAAAPLFRQRQDMGGGNAAAVPPVIPIVRAPDDPGIDDEPVGDEFAEQINPGQGQSGGWRGFLARWGN